MVNPIFVVGSSRSGTTMIGRVLNQHPDIRTFPELHFFEQMCELKDLHNPMSKDEAAVLMDRLIGTMEDGFLHYRRNGGYIEKATSWVELISGTLTPKIIFSAFLEHYSNEADATNACDQTPRNVLFVKDILEAYPDAKVIAMVRDPRSVLLSQKKKWKRKFLGASRIPFRESVRSYFNYHPYTISRLWQASMCAIDKNKDDSRVLVLKYEEVVSHPEAIVKNLCSFLGLEFSPEMLEVPYVGSSSGHDHKEKQMGLATRSIRTSFDGVLTAGERFICEKVTMQHLQQYGYSPSSFNRIPALQLFVYTLLFPVKMSVALLFNIKRMKNIRKSITRRFSSA